MLCCTCHNKSRCIERDICMAEFNHGRQQNSSSQERCSAPDAESRREGGWNADLRADALNQAVHGATTAAAAAGVQDLGRHDAARRLP